MSLICSFFNASMSHHASGAWIEINKKPTEAVVIESHHASGAWIEIAPWYTNVIALASHHASGAWIEIHVLQALFFLFLVASRKWCVD